jgi:hypothetical protein
MLKTPFPIDVAVKVFDMDIANSLDLYNRSLLLEILTETSFGAINKPGIGHTAYTRQ